MKPVIKILIPILILGGAYKALMLPNNDLGYAPEQPIPFSHALHAGTNGIQCQYCHVGVEKTAHATVPSLNICMNCHREVKKDSPDIKKLTSAYERGQSIQWTKVHDLPDHARFVHSRHIAAGVNCKNCHGEVATMEKVEKVNRLNMGTCLNCHREPHETIIQVKNQQDKIQPKSEVELKELKVATNCSTCHY